MAALFVALDDDLLAYVPAANQDSTPYLAHARNDPEAIDKAFRFRLGFLRRLNGIKRLHSDQGEHGVRGRLSSELLALCEVTFR
eukprot:jgi/Tetstr1/421430/TSEL_012379.t1